MNHIPFLAAYIWVTVTCEADESAVHRRDTFYPYVALNSLHRHQEISRNAEQSHKSSCERPRHAKQPDARDDYWRIAFMRPNLDAIIHVTWLMMRRVIVSVGYPTDSISSKTTRQRPSLLRVHFSSSPRYVSKLGLNPCAFICSR